MEAPPKPPEASVEAPVKLSQADNGEKASSELSERKQPDPLTEEEAGAEALQKSLEAADPKDIALQKSSEAADPENAASLESQKSRSPEQRAVEQPKQLYVPPPTTGINFLYFL